MPTVKFYHMNESPPCRTVEMVANMVGVKLDKHHLNLMAGEHLSEDYVKLNPLHKVPFIVDGEFKLGESRAIAMYLVNKYAPNSSLYPQEPTKRALIDELLYYEMGTITSALYKVFGPVVRGKESDPEDVKALRECLQQFDKRLGDRMTKFMTGDKLTIGDISLVATLNYLLVIDFDLSEFNNVTEYIESVRESIPKYGEINDKANENFRQMLKSMRAGK